MIDNPTKPCYEAFGLRINSDIALPELMQAAPDSKIDVEIRYKDLSQEWNSHSLGQKQVAVAKKGYFIFKVPGNAIYQVIDGKHIFISPLPGSTEDKIRLYILGSCMGALLLQNSILPLHGSAIVLNGKAYAFVGESGAGKSTLSSVFMKKGYKLLSDDLIALSFKEGVPYVIPAYPQQKLWENSILEFSLNTEDYKPLADRETKYAIPRDAEFCKELTPLTGIFELSVQTDNEDVILEQVKPLEKIQLLFQHTFRQFLIQKFDLVEWHFNTSAQIAGHTAIYHLKRPQQGFTAQLLAEHVVEEISREV
ncbi:aldolase [Bacillus gobiensis]|uniref:aldolase n=1 Tax=Bacillus gobiensis TaxID=1441095 RepID=UPI003D22661F